ncbi:helix-turn-helix domain-containing protein [Labilibacter marinus]|uniref:helix-turn-helix domain-containing protein n=1 Tax=Labilibacter marinus TaxID=1477105 RepID=UPI00094FFA20|nr:helix-turn-helix transcriptional regulator [Labilibacter marinus]
MGALHIVEAGYVCPIIQKLNAVGVSTDKYIKANFLNKYRLSANTYIPVELMYSLFETIEKSQGVQFLDFFRDTININDLSDNVQDIIRTPDLLHIVQTTCQFNHLIMSNELMTLNIEGPISTLQLQVDNRPSLGRELAIKLSMLYTLDGIQVAAGNDWMPIEIHYQFKKPAIEDPFIDLGKNVNIKYNMPYSGFVFNTADLTKFKVNRKQELEWNVNDTCLAGRIELLLNSIKTGQIPNISYFSDVMNISSRSLIRKLQAEGRSFASIIETWRLKKAIISIENQATSINELAHELGYANHSNFIRAFKRWTGVSPMNYREH